MIINVLQLKRALVKEDYRNDGLFYMTEISTLLFNKVFILNNYQQNYLTEPYIKKRSQSI